MGLGWSTPWSLGMVDADFWDSKYQADYEADFDVLKSQSTIVRGYSASDCNCAQYILPAAKSKGFKVMLGIW